MSETIDMARSLVLNLKDLGGKGTIGLNCDCGRQAEDVTFEGGEERVKELLDHILFRHSSRRDIFITREAQLMTGYELARMADLPPLTQHEENWRRDNPPRPLALPRP